MLQYRIDRLRRLDRAGDSMTVDEMEIIQKELTTAWERAAKMCYLAEAAKMALADHDLELARKFLDQVIAG